MIEFQKNGAGTIDFQKNNASLSFSETVLKGDKGDPGITPHIGENGNWYIGNTDTGKPSRGEKGEGTSDFVIKMTVESNGDFDYTVTSCDTTLEQIDAAFAAGKRAVVIVSVDGYILELPMIQGIEGNLYYFGVFSGSQIVTSFVEKIGNTSNWEFDMNQIQSEDVGYSNAALPNGVTNVKMALDELVPKSHTHANKDTLDKLSVSNGKLQYNNSDVGLKGDKGDTPVKGIDYWTAADKAEIVADTLAALPTWTGGNY